MLNRNIGAYLRSLILLSSSILGLLAAYSASAQSPGFGLKPHEAGKAYFEYTIAPGGKVKDFLVANNPGDAPVALIIQTVRGMTASNGGVTFGTDTTGPAQWIKLPDAGTVEVPAQAAQSLPFEVNVPLDTPPGDYVAGFLAQIAESPQATGLTVDGASNNESSFQVKVVSKMGVAVVITVPEASRCEATIPSLTAGSLGGRWQFAIGLQNTGNVHFKATGDVTARPVGGGDPIAQDKFAVGYFIPGDVINYPLSLDPFPPAGDYQIEVNLLTDCGFQTTYMQPVSVSATNVEKAAVEARAQSRPSAAADEAAKMLAQAQLLQSIALLVGVCAVLVIALVVIVFVTRRRKSA